MFDPSGIFSFGASSDALAEPSNLRRNTSHSGVILFQPTRIVHSIFAIRGTFHRFALRDHPAVRQVKFAGASALLFSLAEWFCDWRFVLRALVFANSPCFEISRFGCANTF
ncbi:hypothetical protein EON80_15720 [bacterium]|nr:MAG: hypothetical protein EON80_15720 [bacterium]